MHLAWSPQTKYALCGIDNTAQAGLMRGSAGDSQLVAMPAATGSLRNALSKAPASAKEAAAHASLFWAARAPSDAATATCLRLVSDVIMVRSHTSLLMGLIWLVTFGVSS